MELKSIESKVKKVSESLPLTEPKKFSSHGNLVEVYDKEHRHVCGFDTLDGAADYLGLSRPTLSRYAKNENSLTE